MSADRYLFLYPIQHYVDSSLEVLHGMFRRAGGRVGYLSDVIDARYRNNGYTIHWLFFGVEGDESMPDVSARARGVRIGKDDELHSCGITFDRHCSQKEYPSSDRILDALGQTKRLVLGGFHQWDCVERVAATAYAKNIDVFVDEDTTDHFFGRCTFGTVPLVRDHWSLEDLCVMPSSPSLRTEIASHRRDRPWLAQPLSL